MSDIPTRAPSRTYVASADGSMVAIGFDRVTKDAWTLHRHVSPTERIHPSTSIVFSDQRAAALLATLTEMLRYPHPRTIKLSYGMLSVDMDYTVTLTRHSFEIAWGRGLTIVLELNELRPLLHLIRSNLHGPMSAMALAAEDDTFTNALR